MYKLKGNLFQLRKRYCKKLSRSLSAVAQASKYKEGDRILGYAVKQVQEVPELSLVAIRLQHEKTGADHLHIAREDKNNVFSVAFKTTPKNDTGVPHILEHITLAGSQRYPCRDPFFKMLNRSLATFMNAFTGSDYTMYPFSTQNSKDFENLLRVYLDAVFHPCLRERDFRQEGWRLEHEDMNDKNTPIILKGVVFNEMKGVFSDPNQHFMQHLQNKIFPSNAYSYVSGGDPLQIPNLTWEELKQFHAEYYHPSNSRFYTYGNFPLEFHLSLIENYALERFSKISAKTDVLEEEIWQNPEEFSIHCRSDPMAAIQEKQTTVSVSYLLNKITDTYDTFTMIILSNLLIDGPNAPFYRSLLEPCIGSDYSPATGYEGQTKQSFFSVGLREIHYNDVQKVKSIIEETLDDVIKNGFPKERIEGAIHNIELSTKHQTTNFGLSVIMSINALWNHGGNPINGLKVNEHVHWFRQQIEKNPKFLQEKISQYFKGNNHKLTLVMTPDQSYEIETQRKEQELLELKLSALTQEEKQTIYNEGIELYKFQQKAEDISCLPTLHINDVQKIIEKTQFENIVIEGVPLQLCEQPTNGIIYFKALSTVTELPENLQMLLPLFSNILTKMGAGDRNYKQLDQEAELTTNGLGAAIHVSEDISNCKVFENGILFTSHCLEKNLNRMMNLWKDIFNRLHLEDKERLSQLIKMTASDLAQGIVYEGHIYTMRKASSCLSACSNLREHLSGLSQVSYMKKLAEMNNYEEVIENLRSLATILLKKDSLRCSLNATSAAMHQALDGVGDFLSSLSGQSSINSAKCQGDEFKAAREQVHFVLPYAVNYVGKSIPTVPYTHHDYSSLKTAAKLLSSKYLHREIREKGGAYGGGAALSYGGDFMFYSYRDPNVVQTLQSFVSGADWLSKGEYTIQDIDEAKLGVFGEVDQPVAPGVKGMSQFLNGITDNKRQQFRESLFSVTKEDIISITNRYLIEPKVCGMSLIGPENDITNNNQEWIVHVE